MITTKTGEKCEPWRLSAGALMTALLLSSTWLLHIFTRKESKIQLGKRARQIFKRHETSNKTTRKRAQKAIPAHAPQRTRTRDVLGSATKWKWAGACEKKKRSSAEPGQRQEGQRKTETEQVRSPINKWPLKNRKLLRASERATRDAKRCSRAKERELPPHPREIRRNEGTHMESEQFEIRCDCH